VQFIVCAAALLNGAIRLYWAGCEPRVRRSDVLRRVNDTLIARPTITSTVHTLSGPRNSRTFSVHSPGSATKGRPTAAATAGGADLFHQ
jgi:hypothetical protein